MSMITEMLVEECDRLSRSISAFAKIINEHPKGSIVWKNIKNQSYPYLQWREGKKVRSRYVKKEELTELQNLIQRRQEYERNVAGMQETKKELEKMLQRKRKV